LADAPAENRRGEAWCMPCDDPTVWDRAREKVLPMGLAKLAEECADAIAGATSLDDLGPVLAVIALEMGFRYFALTHHLDIARADAGGATS